MDFSILPVGKREPSKKASEFREDEQPEARLRVLQRVNLSKDLQRWTQLDVHGGH